MSTSQKEGPPSRLPYAACLFHPSSVIPSTRRRRVRDQLWTISLSFPCFLSLLLPVFAFSLLSLWYVNVPSFASIGPSSLCLPAPRAENEPTARTRYEERRRGLPFPPFPLSVASILIDIITSFFIVLSFYHFLFPLPVPL